MAIDSDGIVVKSGNPELHSAPRTWRSFRWLWDPTTTALCVGPFVWALPIVAAAIETLTYCNIDDYSYQLISSLILGVPLIVSASLALVTLTLIARVYIRDRAAASQSINVPLAFRFVVIVLQIFVMAIVLLCEISLRDDQLRGVFRFHLYWTALVPLILFVVFGTQKDLVYIWRYWIYRLVGKERASTPRSSDEAATVSNSSGPVTAANGHFVISTTTPASRELDAVGRKAHRASSSAGGRDSASISDPPGLFPVKNTTDLHHDEAISDSDLELALSTTNVSPGKQTQQVPPLAFPALPYSAETPALSSPITNARRVDFYSTAADLSSQGFNSMISHSGGHGSLASHHGPSRPDRPLVVVSDGFGAVFGAQVPSTHGRTMGRPIISPQERDRRLAVPMTARRPSFNGGGQLERRRSTGLPPPPRSPRQSSARPASAGGTGVLECGTGERGSPPLPGSGISVTAPTPVATTWDWDSPFRPIGRSAPLAPTVTRGSGSGSGGRGDLDGIEMQEHLGTPSNGSFEHGQRPSHEQHGDGACRSWARASRASVASDRTFG
ncbi:hypothetical protein FRC10_011900 [Ceratobasidium sp. 414]|nr:hypothetical protein FRC10_011900 [Ceratobasidium sp. 414]